MERTKVKICGIRDLETAYAAATAGADFLGFNFIPTSKRYIAVEKAKQILNDLRFRIHDLRIEIVGVFQNQPVEEVNNIVDLIDLDYVQLHGDEDEKYMKSIRNTIIKRIVIPSEGRIEGSVTTKFKNPTKHSLETLMQEISRLHSHFPQGTRNDARRARNDKRIFFLLDRERQGAGEMVPMEKAKIIAEEFRLFLAGGLTPENVSDSVANVRPFAVDVASGIETDGIADNEKIQKFIKNAKGGIV